jgi:peptidoglycan/xylan/chitin deacetylase (PgdA/CDA1 family)
LKQGSQFAENAAVLTFDDGFRDFYLEALPILTRYGFTATVYVVTNYAGETSAWLTGFGEHNRPMLSWPQIREMSALGIEIGAHTKSHPALDGIPLTRAREEIGGSKRALEDKLGAEVLSFAYPFGFYNKAVRSLVEEAGYKSACAVRYAMSSAGDDPFALCRQIVRNGARAARIKALVTRPPLLPQFYDRMRSRTWKLVRQTLQGAH